MTELAMFKLEYEEAKQKLELIETKCHTITREILENRAYLARVRALPQEVLSLVFLFYTQDPLQSPWTLMQVTRTWRATALCTRAIWTKIMITSVIWKEQRQERSYEGREVCVSQQQLGRALHRAGNSPLDILVDCNLGYPRGRRASERDVREFRETVSLLSSPHRCSLVRHFEVQGLYVPRLLGATTSWNFPALETLIISDSALNQMTEAILKSSKRIRKLSTTATAFLCYADLAVPSELTEVHIDASFVQANISLEEARSLRGCLQATLFLTILEIDHLEHHPSIPATTITLPNLQILELHCTSLVWYLDAPSLTTLTCSGDSVFREGPAGSNKFPLLKSLKSNGDLNWEESLKGVPLPSLRDLDIFIFCLTRPRMDTLLEFISDHCHKLVTFRLHFASIVKKDLVDLVCSMPLLEELELERVPIVKGFFTLFMPPKTPSKKPATISNIPPNSFPHLTRLKVDLLFCSLRGQKDAIKAEAKRVIKARVKAGIAMETAQIRFSQEEGWTDLFPKSPQLL
jgi:hypothetical protein